MASIALDDALILPHRANPHGWNFRERIRICNVMLTRAGLSATARFSKFSRCDISAKRNPAATGLANGQIQFTFFGWSEKGAANCGGPHLAKADLLLRHTLDDEGAEFGVVLSENHIRT